LDSIPRIIMPKKTYKTDQKEWKRDHYGMSYKKILKSRKQKI